MHHMLCYSVFDYIEIVFAFASFTLLHWMRKVTEFYDVAFNWTLFTVRVYRKNRTKLRWHTCGCDVAIKGTVMVQLWPYQSRETEKTTKSYMQSASITTQSLLSYTFWLKSKQWLIIISRRVRAWQINMLKPRSRTIKHFFLIHQEKSFQSITAIFQSAAASRRSECYVIDYTYYSKWNALFSQPSMYSIK